MHQKEKKYQLFSTSFKDPMLSDQWYIVSCSLQFMYFYGLSECHCTKRLDQFYLFLVNILLCYSYILYKLSTSLFTLFYFTFVYISLMLYIFLRSLMMPWIGEFGFLRILTSILVVLDLI